MRKTAINVFRVVIALGVAVIALEIGIWLDPPLMAWTLNTASRDKLCSSSEALTGARQHKRVVEGGDDIVKQSRQIEADLKTGLVKYATPYGDWWMPKGSVVPTLLFLSQQKNHIYGEDQWAVHAGDVVVDCGAHVGTYTREALREGASLVVAIEPAPDNVESLRRNFATEIAAGRVIIEPVGVWDVPDTLPLYEDPLNSGGDSFIIRGPNDRVVNVPLVPIDELVRRHGLSRVDFIKMDIKGATQKALIGARETLKQKPRLALSTEEKEDNPREIKALVLQLQPAYRMACGICSVENYAVNPDTILFR